MPPRKKPLERRTGLRPRVGLRPMSKKRRRRLRERRAAVADAFDRAGVPCVAAEVVPEVRCWFFEGRPDPHEFVRRSQWSEGIYVPENIGPVCRGHHDWIGDNPDEATVRGLHVRSYQRPEGEE